MFLLQNIDNLANSFVEIWTFGSFKKNAGGGLENKNKYTSY